MRREPRHDLTSLISGAVVFRCGHGLISGAVVSLNASNSWASKVLTAMRTVKHESNTSCVAAPAQVCGGSVHHVQHV